MKRDDQMDRVIGTIKAHSVLLTDLRRDYETLRRHYESDLERMIDDVERLAKRVTRLEVRSGS